MRVRSRFSCLPVLLAVFLVPLDVTAAQSAAQLLEQAEEALGRRELGEAASAFVAAAEASSDVDIAERATQFTFGVGFDAHAERAVARWIDLMPGNPLANELLGRLKLRRHAVDDAVQSFLAALGPGEPRRDEVYLALASDLSAEPNARLVTRVLSRLAALDPLAAGLQLALGTAALRSGDIALATGAAQNALLDDPDWIEARLLMARAMVRDGRGDEAFAMIDAISRDDPHPLVQLEQARMLADAGRFDEARETLATLTLLFGERPEIIRTLAFLDLAQGNVEQADARFEVLDDGGSGRFESFYYRGQIAGQKGDVEDARRWFARITAGPYLVPAQLAIAESLVRSGEGQQAVDHLAAFGFNYPAQAYDVLEYRAQILLALKRPDEALAVYTEALEYKPTSISVLLARAALLEQQGQVAAALRDLERAVAIAPDDPLALNAYGYTLANRTRHARKAWPYVRRAYELLPASPPVQDSVGWTLFKLGRTEEARSHLEEALRHLPDPEIASHLAEVLWKLGDRAAARNLLSSAAIAHPDSKPVLDTARRLLD